MSALAELFGAAFAEGARGLFVALPGIVTGYDPSTGKASVQPGTKRLKAPTAPGQEPTFETLPVVHVRVLWLGGGGFGIHAPLSEGDRVLLVALDYHPSSFLRTGQVSAPDDWQEHALANSVAIAGLDQPGHAEANAMTLGHPDAPVRLTSQRMEVDGNTDAAALASKLDAVGQVVAGIPDAVGATPVDAAAAAVVAVNLILAAFRATWPAVPPTASVASCASAKIKTGG